MERYDDVWVTHADGVDWLDAPTPRRWHRCRVQTKGWISGQGSFERCACGSIRLDGSRIWLERNSKRKSA